MVSVICVVVLLAVAASVVLRQGDVAGDQDATPAPKPKSAPKPAKARRPPRNRRRRAQLTTASPSFGDRVASAIALAGMITLLGIGAAVLIAVVLVAGTAFLDGALR